MFIDNFDSFTYNLVDEFEKRSCNVLVYRNNVNMDKIDEEVKKFRPDLIVLSPGPSAPKESGNSISIIKKYHKEIPIFGVCLGHQCIIEAFGGNVGKCVETIHGKSSLINHDNKEIYKNIINPFHAGRYHSLVGCKLPNCLYVTAFTSDKKIVMGVRHKKYFVEGVQFHPESILTPVGGKIIENILQRLK